MFDEQHPLFRTYKVAKRIAIGIVGGSLLVMGVVMMITPGPGIAAILAGLGILAIEFAWARIWLKKIKAKAQSVTRNFNNRTGNNRNGKGDNTPTPPAESP